LRFLWQLHAVQVVSASASAQRERISSAGTDAEDEDGHHDRRASSSASDDVHVGAFVARKATFERIQGCGAIACAPTSKSVFAASFTLRLVVPRSHCSSTVTRDELGNRVLFGSCTASARGLGFKALQLRFQSRRRAGSASNC
jgi:hypothetical protein